MNRAKLYMKNLFLIGLGMLMTLNAWAREGASCDNAIPIDVEYSGTFAAGEYWLTANTLALPLTIYYYPEDTTAKAPEIWLDLTCTPGVYDDPIVADMIAAAGEFNLTFPMKEIPDKEYDEEGRMRYTIVYDRNYRDMLYNKGVTYAIPAYVRLVNYTQATMDIVSTSINSQCRDYVNTLGMDAALRYAPSDSLYVHLWPVGEWINRYYRITWEGEGTLDFIVGKDCKVERNKRVWKTFALPAETIEMNPRLTSDWVQEIYSTDLYLRLYAEQEGVLKIESYERKNQLLEVIIDGISAAIDHEALTITVVLPSGTSRANIIKAVKAAEFRYVSYDNTEPVVDRLGGEITFGNIVYKVSATAAAAPGNTDATLATLTVDGYTVDGFLPATLDYNNVEVTTETPLVEAKAMVETSTIVIEQAASVPGTAIVKVTAQAGNSQTYTLHLIAGRSKDASLASVMLDGQPLSSFSSDEYTYRLPVSRLPKVTAQATDSKAAVLIEQAKGIPGFAQIRVTAEAGNTQTYTLNFVMDPRFEACLGATETLKIGEAVGLAADDADKVLNIPVKDWMERFVRFTWTGSADLPVYIGTSCFFDPQYPDETLVDSFVVKLPVGEDFRHYDFRPADLKALARLSLDGTLYLRFAIAEDGVLAVTEWTENCLTQSTLFALPSENEIIASSSAKYRFYLPHWVNNNDVRFIWTGESACKIFVADACDFYLTDNNIHVLRPSPFNLSAGNDSVDIDAATLSDWAWDADNGFLYMRFVNSLPGILQIKKISNGVFTRNNIFGQSALNVRTIAHGWEFVSAIEQDITVWTLDGRRITSLSLAPEMPVPLILPTGMYLVRHADGVEKLISQ